ncbi:DUF6541 family protein [Microbacterium arborescens]|uniref:DUF6541 family protein n=1 Tax=Microbacterium arborescens TaxID=33883 RepID=UPI0013B3C5C7|nr:DUF6541 family protein [Microbacterium arborescens]
MGSWFSVLPSLLIAVVILIVPGLVVIAAGWGLRTPTRWLLAPAVSVTIAAGAATVAPLVGLPWGVWPMLVMTVVITGIAVLLRRLAGPDPLTAPRRADVTALLSLAFAAVVNTVLFARAFGAPANIAQRFDNIVHLNAIGLATQVGDASPFQIGATSDIPAYPNGWHAFTALVVELTGSSVPVGVNVANLAIVAILWPASAMALSAALFRQRRLVFIASAALSTGFGAFPALFFNWGVLYPNLMGYAMVPAGLAAVVLSMEERRGGLVRALLLAALIGGGVFLGHPNAFLALLAFATVFVVSSLTARVVSNPTRVDWVLLASVTAGLALVSVAVWTVFRTSPEHSWWSPWQDPAQALGQGLLVAPRGFTPTVTIAVLLIAAAVAVARRPRLLPSVLPFAVAVLLFVVASGLRIDHPVREILTNPWYNDSNRLAALIPLAAVPAATLGAVVIVDASRRLAARLGLPRWSRQLAGAVALALLATVALGPNARIALAEVREAYAYTEEAPILTEEEQALLERLDETTPPDALIIGSPRTGASLALAFAEREVTERHVFGSPSEDLLFLNRHLRDIDEDPQVCSVVDRLGIDYVLDFGRHDVMDQSLAPAYDGVQDLDPGEHLVLVDSEGTDARLFRIEGC